MTRILAALAPLTLFATPIAAQDESLPEAEIYATQLVVIETAMGDITVEIEIERAPVTAGNFLRYVDEDRFDGTTFYRAMHLDWGESPNGLLQGGTQMHPDRGLHPIAHEPPTQNPLTIHHLRRRRIAQ